MLRSLFGCATPLHLNQEISKLLKSRLDAGFLLSAVLVLVISGFGYILSSIPTIYTRRTVAKLHEYI